MATTLFLGGGAIPFLPDVSGWWQFLAFLIKMFLFLFLFIWLRGTLPRLRYDQFMRLGWKVLVPASLLWILLNFAIRAFRNSGGGTAALIIAVVMTAFLVPDKNGPHEPLVELASDYPVPPLGLAVPSRPRHRRSTGPRQAELDNAQQAISSRQRE